MSETDNPFTMPNITRHKYVNTSGRSILIQPAECCVSLRPATQIAPKSSLGAVLSEIALRYQTHSPVRRHENPDDVDLSSPLSSKSQDSDESYPLLSERDHQ